ncbi:MAG TPA: hypothetical protein VN253_14705 [Kofleriaceae bacterium]|nr:hypothetical protein [Kofleriaceae bacterium]
MSLGRLALAALLLSTGTAAAQTVVATDGYAGSPAPRRLEARAGMLLGGSDVGDADGFSIGVSTGLGYRIGDVTLRGRFDYYRTGDSSDEDVVRRGRGTRVGGAVRYSFANTGDPRGGAGVGVDFWGEAGLGLEHVAWRQGGVLDRPSGELALGFDLDGYGRQDRDGRRRHVGYFMAFRSFLGQGPEMDGPAVCGGPCTRATKPSRIDVSMFYELGLHWGR